MTGAHDTVRGFLRSVVGRAWFVATIDSARDALWLVSISLLALAGVHVGPMPVPPAAILLVIAAIALGTLLRILSRRPSLSAAAALADRQFDGNALMTTAVECLPQASLSDSRAAAVVLDQASNAAGTWAPKLKSAIRAPRRRATTIALIPLFVAVILLTRPGGDTLNGDISETSEPAIVQSGDEDDTTAVLATLRRELIQESTIADRSVATPADDAASLQPVPLDAIPKTDTTEIEADLDGLPGGTASAANDSGDLAGDALPGSTETSDALASNLALGESIDIAREGQSSATASPGGSAYADSSASMPYFAVDALPAAPPDFGDQTALSAAQAAYAARYLSATGDDNE
jgi:hypothetical protein